MSNPLADSHNPKFQWSFLHPRNAGHWLVIGLLWLLAFVPYQLRDRLATLLSRLTGRKGSASRRKAEINLKLCFPEWSQQQVDQVLDTMFARAAQVMLAYGVLSARSKSYLEKKVRLHGEQHLLPLIEAGKPVVLMAPHCWAMEFPGVLLASRGYRWTTMMKPDPNPLMDWAMLLGRNRFPGKLYTRQHGIKAVLDRLNEGYLAYYLPDQDHGMAKSEYVPFFATHKATLPGLGRMVDATGAVVVPISAGYDPQTGLFEGYIYPPVTDLPSGDRATDARIMNRELEQMLSRDPAQYMWILKILKSRPEGEADPYRRQA
ncbi:lauroyl-Kdo(2)-lipid IV(A) myristoyltransferase [Ferrimonas senticii]|uniref:lauroyl-Kdo(2)-lipid IV(A) myristoyltransferase n=1 Tax=Ferrimonas senticii TaxID=394566 RepID=UPI00048749F4|nr:lauroyl-Kdo(2)-lipid IV(A) myristoyltransferase [Ferrimonas senticii]